ncbi:MAG: sugar ABC transporter substrate-binding protein, partial [Lachnospiraceae bacterium]|nr:sugar ABC transporter substrate-binding protein [Lachnospiraceae bacterium]
MKKKVLSILIATAMTATLLAGCGGAAEVTGDSAPAAAETAGTEEAAPSADVSSEGEHELSVYAWDAN